jgi:hypothetical protein
VEGEEDAVRWSKSFAGACVLVLVAQGAIAAGKQRRQWVDPPVDLPAASVREPVSPQATDSPEDDATGSVEVWPAHATVPPTQPQVIDAARPGSAPCAIRVYTVLSGATIRVHAC